MEHYGCSQLLTKGASIPTGRAAADLLVGKVLGHAPPYSPPAKVSFIYSPKPEEGVHLDRSVCCQRVAPPEKVEILT